MGIETHDVSIGDPDGCRLSSLLATLGRAMAFAGIAGGVFAAGGCHDTGASGVASAAQSGGGTQIADSHYEAVTDGVFLGGAQWDDSKAEIAFYQVERRHNQYGEAKPQKFLMGTYLVKHDFDRLTESKARRGGAGLPAFKWSAFYEFESDNSYQYKLAYVVNAAQSNLKPLKASFTSFDWCSNQYRELSFLPTGEVRSLRRSDDYANTDSTFTPDTNLPIIPVTLVPLWVRALDSNGGASHRFAVVTDDAQLIPAVATVVGESELSVAGKSYLAEQVRLSYEGSVPSILGSRRRGADREQTYWRQKGGARILLRLESESHHMELVETVRSAYWSENVYDRLRRVSERP